MPCYLVRMHDYLREIDLNPPPAMGGPINNPLDPRAMHYFGFLSEGQEIVLVQPFTGGPPRIFISWQYANNPLPPPAAPQPPPPVDAIADFSGGPPGVRYETHHERAHAIIWLDPNAPTPTGPMTVRVRAWATK